MTTFSTLLIFLAVLAGIIFRLWPFLKASKTDAGVTDDSVADFAAATARLAERIDSIERIIAAENPNWNR